ncbi:MAG: histidine kinase [Phenylobacterium zucineum]|nr:MAG: histidine kinase [Phenylobacterium zucineum]
MHAATHRTGAAPVFRDNAVTDRPPARYGNKRDWPSETQVRLGTRLTTGFSEEARLTLLGDYGAEALADHPLLQEITAFGSRLCETPICLVSLVEDVRQRFIGRHGLAARETPREVSFCQYAMQGNDLLLVRDAREDATFAQNALVTGEPFIRFYAGVPLRASNGVPLGALCVIDTEPRDGLSDLQAQGLRLLARQVMGVLDARRDGIIAARVQSATAEALEDHENRFRVLADTMPQIVWSTLPDGYHDYYNARWYEFTGAPEGSTDGEGWNGMFHPDDQPHAWARWRHSLETGEPYEIEYRLRNAAGAYRWTLGRALPMRAPDGRIVRWFGTCTDIHDQRRLLEERQVVSQELSHRIKNIFAIIAGMISLSARQHPEARPIAADLRDRVVALGRAHDFVRPHSPQSQPAGSPSSLQGMLGALFEPYQTPEADRVVILGEDAIIDDRACTPLALVFHELVTNAAKYGALAEPDGRVRLVLGVLADDVTFDWQETTVRGDVVAPTTSGFGTDLIDVSLRRQLSGEYERTWAPEGLRFTARCPKATLNRL